MDKIKPLLAIPSIQCHVVGTWEGELFVAADEWLAYEGAALISNRISAYRTEREDTFLIPNPVGTFLGDNLSGYVDEVRLQKYVLGKTFLVKAGFYDKGTGWKVWVINPNIRCVKPVPKKRWQDHPYLKNEDALL